MQENQKDKVGEIEVGEVFEIPKGSSFSEQLLRSIIQGYQDNINKDNDKSESQFILTITVHKVATPEGNKDVAYLRLDRHSRDRVEGQKEEDGWSSTLIHQEYYIFKNIKERVNPRARWKEQLFVNALARLAAAGVEYAELLRRLKQREDAEKQLELQKPSIEITSQMPAPLTKADEDYKQWLAEERKKEGL